MAETKHITLRQKRVFLWTLVLGLLTHGFRLSNKFLCCDSYNYLESISRSWTVAMGRYLLHLVEAVRGNYELTWLIGLLSIIFIAAAAVLVAEIFDIRDSFLQVLTGFIMVANPVVTGTFAYMYTADGYFFGMMLSVLAVYLLFVYQGKWGIPLAALSLAASMAFYQSYLSVTIVLIMFKLLLLLLDKEKKLKEVFRTAGICLTAGITAMVVYLAGMKLAWQIFDSEMADYMGLKDARGGIVSRITGAFVSSYVEFARFLLVRWKLTFYNVTNVLVILVVTAMVLTLIIKRKLYKEPLKVILMVLLGLLLPVATHIFAFISEGVSYISSPMSYSMCLIWIMPLLLGGKLKASAGDGNKLKIGTAFIWRALLTAVCLHFVVIAAQSYESMDRANRQTERLINRIEARMELEEGYSDDMDIAIYGNLWQMPEYVPSAPMMSGVVSNIYLSTQREYVAALNWYVSAEYGNAGEKRKKELAKLPEFSEMKPWPSKDSVKVIDGTMILFLSDDEIEKYTEE